MAQVRLGADVLALRLMAGGYGYHADWFKNESCAGGIGCGVRDPPLYGCSCANARLGA